jgi:hypothetical protein
MACDFTCHKDYVPQQLNPEYYARDADRDLWGFLLRRDHLPEYVFCMG